MRPFPTAFAGRALVALGLLVQGASVLQAARAGRLPAVSWPALAGASALLAVAGALLWRRAQEGPRRPLLLGLALAQAGCAALLWTARPAPVPDEAAVREALTRAAGSLAAAAGRVDGALDALSAYGARRAPRSEPFELAAELSDVWRRQDEAPPGWALAALLWREGERIAWSGRAQPLGPPPPSESLSGGRGGQVVAGPDGWTWRRFRALPGVPGGPAVLELQLNIAPLGGARDAVPLGAARPFARTITLEPGGGSTAPVIAGDDVGGLRAVALHGLPDPGPDGAAWRLRIEAVGQPRAAVTQVAGARRLLLLLGLWGVTLAGAGAVAGGGGTALAAAWAARLLLARVDLLRWVQPAFPRGTWPAPPGDAASLVDPAYFATPALGGLLASAADAVMTGLLLAATALVVGARVAPRTAPWPAPAPRARRAPERAWGLPAALLWAAALVGVLLAARWLAATMAENANPRLIGLRAPYRFLSFWALHLALLLAVGAPLLLLQRLATGLRGGPAAAAALAGSALAAWSRPDLGTGGRLALVGACLLLLAVARETRRRGPSARRLGWVAGALVVVGWNYVSLAQAYGRGELAWLERKGEEIVQPQQEWLGFLLGDALTGMALADAGGGATPAPASPAAPDLWRNRAAYDLWRGSAVRDLGLPCLVEVFDRDGRSASLFASGFFRDFGYEVGERTAWSPVAVAPAGGRPAQEVRSQGERRRYPAGDEWILRGEIARAGGAGWIRLELPARSRRIRTLLAQLEGAQAPAGVGGYLPRAELDRPVLLVRGDDTGWLDAGPGPFPGPEAQAAVAGLKADRAARARVRAGGRDHVCLWQPVPAALAASPGEGFLLGIERPPFGERLLDLSRLCLLDLLLVLLLALPALAARAVRRRGRPAAGFQERFLAATLALGLLPLLLAGVFLDRSTVQGQAAGAREQARDGLEAAIAQLQGLLGEQARALAGSEYIADLLASRLAGQRPLGPFSARQAIVFGGDGRLLLDETLSDLDDDEAARLLATARAEPLVLMESGGELSLGLVVPVDLSDLVPGTGPDTAAAAPATPPSREAGGWFFYRQRVDDGLMSGLAEIVQGEVALSTQGETVLTSHPERVFAGERPLLLPPDVARRLARWPGSPDVALAPGTRLAFTASQALPVLSIDERSGLRRRALPGALSVAFPARERQLSEQRERFVLFLAGTATLICLTVAALGLALAWRIFGPVRVLVDATRRLAGGDFAAPLPEEGRDEVGQLSASFRAMRDDLARAQRELARRERFLATILERVPVGVAVVRDDGGVAALNPAAVGILAAAGEEAARDPAAAATALLSAFRARLAGAAEGEAELRPGGGRRTLRGRLAPLRAADDGGDTLLVFEDVTEFLDNKRLALNAELARQVAHEIKNPLTPIQLSVQFLEQAYRDRAAGLDDIVRDTVRQVLGQVALLRQIATEFSLLGKPGALAVAPVDLPAEVAGVAERYRAGDGPEGAAGPGIRLRVAPGPVPPALADAESLARVLGNLMENSLQAVGDPARLELDIGWEVTPREVTLLWADNGPGLPADVADRLFELYFSTKSQGTGLGLAICRSLLERMGGRISLANRAEGTGAVAAVTLARALEPATAPGEGDPLAD